MGRIVEVREVPGLKKKPSISELLDGLKLLLNEEMTPEQLRERDPRKLIQPLHGALLKNEQELHLEDRQLRRRRAGQGAFDPMAENLTSAAAPLHRSRPIFKTD